MGSDGVADDGWNALGLTPGLAAHLCQLGFERPTELQRTLIPPVLNESNVVMEAPCGSGRTLAIGVLVADLVADCEPGDSPVVLVITSSETRCHQLQSTIRAVGQQLARSGPHGIRSAVVSELGPADTQAVQLKTPLDVVIGTPRRVAELAENESLDPSTIELLIIEQADDLSVGDDQNAVIQLLETVKHDRQKVVMAGALLAPLEDIVESMITTPARPEVPAPPLTRKPIRQSAFAVGPPDPEIVARLAGALGLSSAVVLVRPRLMAEFSDYFSRGPLPVTVMPLESTGPLPPGATIILASLPTSTSRYADLLERASTAGAAEVILLTKPAHRHLLRAFGRVAGIQLNAHPAPVAASVEAARALRTEDLLIQKLGRVSAQPTPRFLASVQRLSASYDVADIASAAMDLAHEALLAGIEPGSDIPMLLRQSTAKPPEGDRRQTTAESSGPNRRKVPDRRAKDLEPGMTRLFVAAGYNLGVRPGDIVGSFAGESGLSGKEIGNIDIRETFTLVEVPEALADDVVQAMADGTIKGRQIEVRRERY